LADNIYYRKEDTMTIDKDKTQKHLYNLLKTVEGTGWILCDAITYMAENNIVPDKDNDGDSASPIAQNIAEIFEIISECEESEVIDHVADKMLEYAGANKAMLLSYLDKYMGDNPLYQRIVENSKTTGLH
jgi:hypothetical protein